MLLSAKTLLVQTWKIYEKRFWVFFGIVIVPLFASSFLASVLFPLRIRMISFKPESFGALSAESLVFIGFLVLVGTIIHLLSQTALIYAIKDREENIGVKESYLRGWNKIISFFWIYLLSDFIVIVGFFLFLVPGLIFLIWFIFAPFILITENKKGLAALLASKDYVKNNWFPVFGRFLIVGILAWLVLWAISSIFGFIGIGNVNKINLYAGYMLFNPMMAIYSFLIYENLKSIKKGDNAKKTEHNPSQK